MLKWYKDGKEIKAGDIFALKGDPSSLGLYSCEAINCMGSCMSSSKVHMGGPDGEEKVEVSQDLINGKVRVGERHEFAVKLGKMRSNLKAVWSNKGKVIEPSDRIIQTIDGTLVRLVINQVEVQDDGEWTCEIFACGVNNHQNGANNNNSVRSSATLQILIPRNYRKPRFLENLKAILTDEGLVSFECKVCGFPTPILRWYKDGYELKPGDVYQLSGANSLGVYTCVAHNCMGDAESSTELTLDDIQHQLSDDEKRSITDSRPPKFLKGLKSCELKIMDGLELQVQISDPKAEVAWFKDGNAFVPDETHVIISDGSLSTLRIKSLEYEDQGEWKCTTSNEYGHSFTSAKVKLIVPTHYKKPKFLESLRAILSDEGTVNLECKVIGVPVPVLKWYKDGVELKAGDIHRIISGADGTCCLGKIHIPLFNLVSQQLVYCLIVSNFDLQEPIPVKQRIAWAWFPAPRRY
jgi:hypothetical protein